MDSANLLVADRSPEVAEQINSLLRNSGIKIHVMYVDSVKELDRALRRDDPLLVICANPDKRKARSCGTGGNDRPGVRTVSDAAGPDQLEDVAEVLASSPCHVVNADDENQLTGTVSRLFDDRLKMSRQSERETYIEELEHRYNLLLDSSRDAIAYVHEGLHIYANRSYREALKLGEEEDVSAISLLEIVDSGDTDFKKLLKSLSRGEFPDELLPAVIKRPDGSEFEANLFFLPARYNGEDCIQVMVQERARRSALAAELERVRNLDPPDGPAEPQRICRRARKPHHDEPGIRGIGAVLYVEPDGIAEVEESLDIAGLDAYISTLAGSGARPAGRQRCGIEAGSPRSCGLHPARRQGRPGNGGPGHSE